MKRFNDEEIGNMLTSGTEENEDHCGWCLENGERHMVRSEREEMHRQDHVGLTGYQGA